MSLGLALGLPRELGGDAAVAASLYLDWSNYQSELIRVQNDNSIPDVQFNAMVNWIFFDVSTFNYANATPLNSGLTAGNVILISDVEAYAATYVIT